MGQVIEFQGSRGPAVTTTGPALLQLQVRRRRGRVEPAADPRVVAACREARNSNPLAVLVALQDDADQAGRVAADPRTVARALPWLDPRTVAKALALLLVHGVAIVVPADSNGGATAAQPLRNGCTTVAPPLQEQSANDAALRPVPLQPSCSDVAADPAAILHGDGPETPPAAPAPAYVSAPAPASAGGDYPPLGGCHSLQGESIYNPDSKRGVYPPHTPPGGERPAEPAQPIGPDLSADEKRARAESRAKAKVADELAWLRGAMPTELARDVYGRLVEMARDKTRPNSWLAEQLAELRRWAAAIGHRGAVELALGQSLKYARRGFSLKYAQRVAASHLGEIGTAATATPETTEAPDYGW